VVVQISLVLHHPETGPEKFGNRFLRRRLARASGDRHHSRTRRLADCLGEILKRPQRISDFDEPEVQPHLNVETRPSDIVVCARPIEVEAVFDNRAGPASFHHRRHECVAVESGTAQRHEEVPRLERAAVDDDGADPPIAVAVWQPATNRLRHPPRRELELAHPTRDLTRRASSASRATATSSKGNVRPPISWYFS
jgi:hypothetical protein